MTKFSLITILAICATLAGQPAAARADTSWLSTVQTCPEFAQALTRYVADLGDLKAVAPQKRDELMTVLKTACGKRFSSCNFAVCKSMAGELQSESETNEIAHHPDPIVTDPLAWLSNPELSCEGLVDQIKGRYAPLGRYSEMPQQQKDELKKVLDVSCSPRFAHCAFKTCQKLAAAKTEPAPQAAPEPDLKALAEEEFKKIYAEWRKQRRALIDLAREKERAQKIDWRQLGNPEELREAELRREAARRRKQEEQENIEGQRLAEHLEAPFKKNDRAQRSVSGSKAAVQKTPPYSASKQPRSGRSSGKADGKSAEPPRSTPGGQVPAMVPF